MDPWTAAFDLGGGLLDFAGSLVYSEQERTEHQLFQGQLDLEGRKLETQEYLAELASRSSMISAAQGAGSTQTLAIAGVAAVAVIAGALVLVKGG